VDSLASFDVAEVEAKRGETDPVQLAVDVEDDRVVERAAVQRVRMRDGHGRLRIVGGAQRRLEAAYRTFDEELAGRGHRKIIADASLKVAPRSLEPIPLDWARRNR